MTDVQEALDRLVPKPARISAWDEVLRDARPRRRSLSVQLALAAGIVALVALFVVAPWQGSERVGVLDRALGAVGDDPITHAVFRGDWGGTLVDLKSGERKSLYGEKEIWYDPSRNLAHEILRFGGAIEHEELYNPDKSASPFAVLARDYRKALEQGPLASSARTPLTALPSLDHDSPPDAPGRRGQSRPRVRRGRSQSPPKRLSRSQSALCVTGVLSVPSAFSAWSRSRPTRRISPRIRRLRSADGQ